MDRIYTIDINSEFDLRLKEFQKQLKESEQIVSTTLVDKENKLVIVTREPQKRDRRNLLLEEIQKVNNHLALK